MLNRRSRLIRALALVAATLTTVPVMGGTADAGSVAPRPQTIPTHTFTPAGSIGTGGGFGVNGIFVSPDGAKFYGQTYGPVRSLDLATMSIGTDLTMTGSNGQVSTLSPDRTVSYVLTSDGGSTYYIEPITLNTGAVGTASPLGAYGLDMPVNLAVGNVNGVNMAYTYFQGWGSNASNPEIVAVNLDTQTAVDNVEVNGLGFSKGGTSSKYRVALSADGSELYLSHGTEVFVFDPEDLTATPTSFALANAEQIVVWDDEPLNSTNKGILFAASDGTFTKYDLDTASTVFTSSVRAGQSYSPTFMHVLKGGEVVTGDFFAYVNWIETDGTVTEIDYSSVLLRPGSDPYLYGLYVDENPTYGTCIFTVNNYDGSYSAIAVDDADCGPFTPRLGDLADIEIDGSSTLTIDAPTPTSRAAEWSAIAVYAGCELVQVIEPAFPGSLTIDWADVSADTEVTVRAYTADNLTEGSIVDLNTLNCDTPFTEQQSAAVAYNAFEGAQVGAGYDNSCASVTLDSYCWGANDDGQLGDGTADDSYTPTQSADPTATPTDPVGEAFSGSLITDIDSGDGFTCALVSGVLYCWGDNDSGQLGNGTTDGSATPVAVSANAGFTNTNVTAFSTGQQHVCAVESGVAYCWGYDSDGQLGDNTTTDSPLPLKVNTNGGFTNTGVTSVGAGWGHSCAVQSGSVYCWGGNGDGEVGDGTTNDAPLPVEVVDNPGESYTNDNVTQVVASDEGTCAIRSGVVFCWGYDDYGKNGTDEGGDSSEPVMVLDNEDEGFVNTGVSFLTAGEDHYCLLQSGVAYCWGYGSDGQLGYGADDDSGLAVKVLSVEGGFSNAAVTDIDAGFYHTCAIDDGKVYCWGNGDDGQLGNGDDNGSDSPIAVCCAGGGGTDSGEEDVDVTLNGGNGTIVFNGGPVSCTATCTASFPRGTTVTLTAIPAPGYRFLGWSGACSGTGPCVVLLEDALNVTAAFGPAVLPPTGSDPLFTMMAFALLGAGAALQHLARRRRPTA